MNLPGSSNVPSPIEPVVTTKYLLDANMLLRRAEPTHPHHPVAVAAVQVLVRSHALFCLAPQSIYEFWAVATRPVAVRGLGLSGSQTNGFIVQFKSVFELLTDVPAIYSEWERLVIQYGVSGKPSHDARLVAFMLAHHMTHLLTFNGSDFTRYVSEGITVVDPARVIQATS